MLKAITENKYFIKVDEVYTYMARVVVAGYLAGMLYHHYQDSIKEHLYFEQAEEMIHSMKHQKIYKMDGGKYYRILRAGGDVG